MRAQEQAAPRGAAPAATAAMLRSRVVGAFGRLMPRRPARHLTEPQQRALVELAALGAPLDASFSERELRSAFRSLARQLHPDRHPGATVAEQAQRSRQFAFVTDCYRCLLGALT